MKGRGKVNKRMKKVIITGGPTNEPIDEVMKITNMSTGSLSKALAGYFLDAGFEVSLIINNSVDTESLTAKENAENLEVIYVETTQEMLRALQVQSMAGKTDAVIHAAAVGDYKADYTFLLDDLAKYLWPLFEKGEIKTEEELLTAMLRADEYKIDNSSKISSYQKNLTVKLGLTPKIISRLREWYPESLLVGCKLLENVSKEELFEVATRLCNKNNMDYILANDLADLRDGKPARYLVNKDGFTGTTLENPSDIFEFVCEKLQ